MNPVRRKVENNDQSLRSGRAIVNNSWWKLKELDVPCYTVFSVTSTWHMLPMSLSVYLFRCNCQDDHSLTRISEVLLLLSSPRSWWISRPATKLTPKKSLSLQLSILCILPCRSLSHSIFWEGGKILSSFLQYVKPGNIPILYALGQRFHNSNSSATLSGFPMV